MADLIPVTVRISYDALKELLKLPDDVNVLGIHGIDDIGGSFPLIIETPAKHLSRANLSITYRKDGETTSFVGFGS